jgi:hypothetical protein
MDIIFSLFKGVNSKHYSWSMMMCKLFRSFHSEDSLGQEERTTKDWQAILHPLIF